MDKFKLTFKKKEDPHKAILEECLKTNEEYLRTMVAGTEEYDKVNKVVMEQREALMNYNKPKFGFKEIIEVLTVVASFAGIGASVYSTVSNNNTKKEIATWIYQNEEIDGKLANGSIKSIASNK